MTDKTLRRKVSELQQIQTQLATLTTQADKLKAEIKGELETRALDEYKVGSVLVRCKKVISPRFDTTAFKQAHGSLYEQYARMNATRRLTLVAA